MKHEAVFIDENNNRWQFRVDGNTAFVYADCYESAIRKIKDIYGKDTEIKDASDKKQESEDKK